MGNIYLKNLVDSWAETLTKEQLVERQEALADRIEQVQPSIDFGQHHDLLPLFSISQLLEIV